MPLTWLSISFIAGISLGYIFLHSHFWRMGGSISVLLFFVHRIIALKRPDTAIGSTFNKLSVSPALLLTMFFAGGFLFLRTLPDFSNEGFVSYYNDTGEEVVLRGMISGYPDQRDGYMNVQIDAISLRYEGDVRHISIEGKILARFTGNPTLKYGDTVIVRGKLETPFENEDFSYKDYLATKGIHTTLRARSFGVMETGGGNWLKRGIYTLRSHLLEKTYALWVDPEASLLAGILLGVETGIAPNVSSAFRDTGTSHIIAISGFNITIIASLISSLITRLIGKHRLGLASILSVLVVGIYTVLVGADAAVVRAAIMGCIVILGRYIGRSQQGVNGLVFSGAMMAVFDPHILWDVSFQLSFTAAMGLILYADPLKRGFVKLASRVMKQENAKKIGEPVSEFVLYTIAAQITALPIMLIHFERFSLSSLLANPLILPAQPLIMLVGGAALLLGAVWQFGGQVMGAIPWALAFYTIRSVEWVAGLRWGAFAVGKLGLSFAVVYYVSLAFFTYRWEQVRDWLKVIFTVSHWRKPAFSIGMILVGLFLWQGASGMPDGKLHIEVFDVGTAIGVLVKSPTGRVVLINGGESTNKLSDALGRNLSFTSRVIDTIIVANAVEEQVGGLARNVERYKVGNVLWVGGKSLSYSADTLRETLNEQNIPISYAEPGQSLELGGGSLIHIVTTGTRGGILLIEYMDFRYLVPIGASVEMFEELNYGSVLGNVSALHLADGGYVPANPAEWVDNLDPQVVLLSVAANDDRGLPDENLLDSLGDKALYRTDQHGNIHITTDGAQMWVDAER